MNSCWRMMEAEIKKNLSRGDIRILKGQESLETQMIPKLSRSMNRANSHVVGPRGCDLVMKVSRVGADFTRCGLMGCELVMKVSRSRRRLYTLWADGL